MALTRVWMPSPNYSGRGGSSVRLIVLHTTEGAQTYQSLGSFFAGPVDASSHAGIDNKVRGTIGEYVSRPNKAWTQSGANPVAVSAELCTPSGAAASWTRDYWLNSQRTLLDNTVDWVREEAAQFGLPIVALTPGQAQGSGRGVCQHSDLGSWGGGHYDCGNGFPMDYIISKASGSAPPPTPAEPAPLLEEPEMPTLLPGRNQPPVGISFTGAGEYVAINLLCDASLAPGGKTQIRIACHRVGTSNWNVITSTLSAANPRQAFDLPSDCDGVSLSRLDDAQLAVVPVFKRRA